MAHGTHLQHAGHEERQHWRMREDFQDDAAHADDADDGGDGQAGEPVLSGGPAGAAAA